MRGWWGLQARPLLSIGEHETRCDGDARTTTPPMLWPCSSTFESTAWYSLDTCANTARPSSKRECPSLGQPVECPTWRPETETGSMAGTEGASAASRVGPVHDSSMPIGPWRARAAPSAHDPRPQTAGAKGRAHGATVGHGQEAARGGEPGGWAQQGREHQTEAKITVQHAPHGS